MPVFNISLNTWSFIKTSICVVFCFIKRISKELVILDPLFSLLLLLFLATLARDGDYVEAVLALPTLIILLREEVYLNVQQSR